MDILQPFKTMTATLKKKTKCTSFPYFTFPFFFLAIFHNKMSKKYSFTHTAVLFPC